MSQPHPVAAAAPTLFSSTPSAWVFPPDLLPILRGKLGPTHPSLEGVDEHFLNDLLAVVFFASLHTHEGTHYPVRIAFSGLSVAHPFSQGGHTKDAANMLHYRWSPLSIAPDRAFCVSELLKLAS